MVLLASVLAAGFSTEKFYEKSSSGIKSSQDKKCTFVWSDTRDRVETSKENVDGGSGILAKADHLFAGVVRQLLLKKKNGKRALSG